MRSTLEGTAERSPPTDVVAQPADTETLVGNIKTWLDDAKAEGVVTIDLAGKTSIGDYMLIASGRSDRHVGAIADQLSMKLKASGVRRVSVEGKESCDWVLIDTGDIIIHVFRPEVRDFYNLEKMWLGERPADTTEH